MNTNTPIAVIVNTDYSPKIIKTFMDVSPSQVYDVAWKELSLMEERKNKAELTLLGKNYDVLCFDNSAEAMNFFVSESIKWEKSRKEKEFVSVGLPFTLTDDSRDDNNTILGKVSTVGGMVFLEVDGCSPDGVVRLDFFDEKLSVTVWSDKDEEEPTHTISLSSSKIKYSPQSIS